MALIDDMLVRRLKDEVFPDGRVERLFSTPFATVAVAMLKEILREREKRGSLYNDAAWVLQASIVIRIALGTDVVDDDERVNLVGAFAILLRHHDCLERMRAYLYAEAEPKTLVDQLSLTMCFVFRSLDDKDPDVQRSVEATIDIVVELLCRSELDPKLAEEVGWFLWLNEPGDAQYGGMLRAVRDLMLLRSNVWRN